MLGFIKCHVSGLSSLLVSTSVVSPGKPATRCRTRDHALSHCLPAGPANPAGSAAKPHVESKHDGAICSKERQACLTKCKAVSQQTTSGAPWRYRRVIGWGAMRARTQLIYTDRGTSIHELSRGRRLCRLHCSTPHPPRLQTGSYLPLNINNTAAG